MAKMNWTMVLGFGWVHSGGRRSPPVAARSVEKTVKNEMAREREGLRCQPGLQL
jgi:hypothetical protein